jgi:hypothetical protein
MNNITKNHKVGIFAIFIASALMVGTISVVGTDTAFATKGKSNDADQAIEQPQSNDQSSRCDTGHFGTLGGIFGPGQEPEGVSAVSCNNAGIQLGANTGQEALGQE